WVQDPSGQQKLERLSQQLTAIPDESVTRESPVSRSGLANAHRAVLATAIVGVLWQLVVIGAAGRSADALEHLSKSAGVSLGAPSSSLVVTHAWWLLAPALCVVWLIVALKRRNSIAGLAVVAMLLGLLLQVWADVGLLQPVRDLMTKAG